MSVKSLCNTSVRFLPAVVWMTIIFVLSSQSSLPGPETVVSDFIFKKSAHIFVYAVLYVLFFFAINGRTRKGNWMIPFILTCAYAITDELHQSLTPFRTARPRDVGYDILGAAIAYLRMNRYI